MTSREVILDGGAPWGFRMHGGADVQQPLRISRVNPGSKAALKGVREGDLITSINDRATRDITNAEAHALLKNAGDSLKLGLNQDRNGSPKRRQYNKTVLQEAHSETVKRSSFSTLTIESSSDPIKPNKNNEQDRESTKLNGDTKENENPINGHSKENDIISQRSTLSSNCSTASTPSTLDSKGGESKRLEDYYEIIEASADNSNLSAVPKPASTVEMADTTTSRSRRRRNRRKAKKMAVSNDGSISADTNDDQLDSLEQCESNTDDQFDIIINQSESDNSSISCSVESSVKKFVNNNEEHYRVESPRTVSKKDCSKSSNITKSKSLDDDEILKITELSETSESEDKNTECNALVSEADSDVEWEVLENLTPPKNVEPTQGTSSMLVSELNEHDITSTVSSIGESQFREFLEGISIKCEPAVSSSSGADKQSAQDIKAKRTKKREELAEYFIPAYQNPRYLDVISEEGSDSSDKEQRERAMIIQKKLLETKEVAQILPSSKPPLNRKSKRVKKILKETFSSSSDQHCADKTNTAVKLVANITDSCNITEDVCKSDFIESSTGVEIVFVDDSSESTDEDNDVNEVEPSNETEEVNIIQENEENEGNEKSIELHQISILEEPQNLSMISQEEAPICELTPPPTPDSVHDNDDTKSKSCLKELETLQQLALNALEECDSSKTLAIVKNDNFSNLPNQLQKNIREKVEKDNNDSQMENMLIKDLQQATYYTNAVSPSPPSKSPSLASDSGSSMATSQVTVQYSPMNSSSVGDISSILKDEEKLKDYENLKSPSSLRDICLRNLISLPFGADILEELADVSKSFEEDLTYKFPNKPIPIQVKASIIAQKLPAFMSKIEMKHSASNNFPLTVLSAPSEQSKQTMENSGKENDKWVGLPTEHDPNVLICLSPTQKNELDKKPKIPQEADKLLDLHEKFSNRRSYYDEIVQNKTINEISISSITKKCEEMRDANNESSKRLLQIIRDSSIDSSESETKQLNQEDDTFLYYEEKDYFPTSDLKKNFVRSYSSTLPRQSGENSDESRLKAKNLSEWLCLAREKSMSNPNLAMKNGEPSPKMRSASSAWQLNYNPKETSSRSNISCDESLFGYIDHKNRRASLPVDYYKKQMEYILRKEREIQEELERLEEEKQRLTEIALTEADDENFQISYHNLSSNEGSAFHNVKGFAEKPKARPKSMPIAPSEYFRQKMYDEYMDKIAAREERKQHKVIKISSAPPPTESDPPKVLDAKHVSGIEDEFMDKVKQRMSKYGISYESNGENQNNEQSESEVIEPVLVMDGGSLTHAMNLPKHLQEIVDITRYGAQEEIKENDDGIWSPGQSTSTDSKYDDLNPCAEREEEDHIPPVWTPKSAGASPVLDRKEFRPVNFQSPKLPRKNKPKSDTSADSTPVEAPWKNPNTSCDIGVALSASLEKRLPTSFSAPASGFIDITAPRLPKAQNPTITLLQKAREGQIPKGAAYIEQYDNTQHTRRSKNEKPPTVGPGEIFYQIKHEYTSESDSEKPRKMAEMSPRKFEGIGPTTKDGMPIILRSEVKDQNQSKWYKRMYDTIHKQKHPDGRYPYMSGYLSEPEPGAYDSDATLSDHKYATLDRRRLQPKDKENEFMSSTMPRSMTSKSTNDVVRHTRDPYKNQPGRIENYIPGHSSISEKEAKEWWDEVMDIFDGHLEQQKHVPHPRSFMNQALKESGYESDSTLVFRRRDDNVQQLNPDQQKEAYKTIQKGGDVPLHGLRKPAPERPKEEEYMDSSTSNVKVTRSDGQKVESEICCYPVNIPDYNARVFGGQKDSNIPPPFIPKPPPLPPSPPKRKSSRNNSTLRLISTIKTKNEKSPICKRHEFCFTSSTEVDKNKVKFLREKITKKLSTSNKKKSEDKGKVKQISKIPTPTTATVAKGSRTTKSPIPRSSSKTSISSKSDISKSPDRYGSLRSSSASPLRKIEKQIALSSLPSTSSKFRGTSLERTFGIEKRKVDLTLPKAPGSRKSALSKTSDLKSPTELKKVSLSQITTLPSGTTYKTTTSLLSSSKNGLTSSHKEKAIPIKVGISGKAREILKLPKLQMRSSSTSKIRTSNVSPAPSSLSEMSRASKSNTSISSLGSVKAPKKIKTNDLNKSSKPKYGKQVKTKEGTVVLKQQKDQVNGEIAKMDKKSSKDKKKLSNSNKTNSKTSDRYNCQNFDYNFNTYASLDHIKRQKEAVQTDSFFQNLLLRDYYEIPPAPLCPKKTWLEEKTLFFEKKKACASEPSFGALKLYLNHTKPVSDSKFKSLDAAIVRSRSVSPMIWRKSGGGVKEIRCLKEKERSISLPPKLIFTETSRPVSPVISKRQFPLHGTSVRPKSPSPTRKLIFSQTSRPISPVIKRKELLQAIEQAEERKMLYFSQTSRPISPSPSRKAIRTPSPCYLYERTKSPDGGQITEKYDKERKLYFTETSRPVSPMVERKIHKSPTRSRSESPSKLFFVGSRSPSPVFKNKVFEELMPSSQHYSSSATNSIERKPSASPSYKLIKQKIPEKRRQIRARSAPEDSSFEKWNPFLQDNLRSTIPVDVQDKREYQSYIKELFHSTCKSNKFKELNEFYSTLEKLGELERTTSSADLRPRRKYEQEIIDFDRWQEVRTREKAEQELKVVFKHLKEGQKEKGLFFLPKDVESFRWRRELDRGLRIKEKSVENLKEEFEKLKNQESERESAKLRELSYTKDVYKPLWRGNSVANLAHTMVEKRAHSEGRISKARQKVIDTERLLTHGIGSRIWSSLSLEQVNILKNQLSEIYNQNPPKRPQEPVSDNCITVSPDKLNSYQSNLKVRRNSDSSERSYTISNINPKPSRNSGDSCHLLTENEKKKLSQSLSKEVLNVVSQKRKSQTIVFGKETRGAIAANEARVSCNEQGFSSPRTCYSLEISDDGFGKTACNKDDFIIVLKNDNTEEPKKPLYKTDATQRTAHYSETESGSTDDSSKTVVYLGNKEDIQKKVEFFETASEREVFVPTVYKPADSPPSNSPEKVQSPTEITKSDETPKKLTPSQSYQDLKELFGEQTLKKMTNESLASSRRTSSSPIRPILRVASPIKSIVSDATSYESLPRSRSTSPYLETWPVAVVRQGDVSKLKNKFETFESRNKSSFRPRRWKSDPQLDRKAQIVIPGQEYGEVDTLRRKYEYPAHAGRGRSRHRRGGVVSPIFLRAEDRFMPHINIISKIASLTKSSSPSREKSRSSEDLADLLGIPVGEVEKMRQKFDSPEREMSLLGQMFTSSPNFKELRDVSSYLTGTWAAHRFPKREDNSRSLSSPDHILSSNGATVTKKVQNRPKSVSPPRTILKSKQCQQKKSKSENTIHKPVCRYYHQTTSKEPLRYKPAWPTISSHNRPTVTFKGVVFAGMKNVNDT